MSIDHHQQSMAYEVSDDLHDLFNTVSSSHSPHHDSADIAVKKEDIDGALGEFRDNSVAGWLARLGLSIYIDRFHQNGYDNLFQLDECKKENLEHMGIPEEDSNKIWKSLLEFHQINQLQDMAQTFGRSSSRSSTESTTTLIFPTQSSTGSSQMSQQSIYNPGYYEVTRYTFKHTISRSRNKLPKNDE